MHYHTKRNAPQIKFDVFERLNTGAVQLNPQELRHGLYHGAFMKKLDELGQYDPWQELSGIHDDKRMRGAELIMRFLALRFNLDAYEKPLATFLNKFAQRQRQRPAADQYEESFKAAVDGVNFLLGKNAFRLLKEDATEGNFNAAIFDAQMVGFAKSGRSTDGVNERQRKIFLQEYRELQRDKDFFRSISASTSDPPLVRTRINMFKDLIERTIPV